ncbi:hypothetical protein GQ607_002456 [Colletotrichum asianum]|uniref:Uncharacterized protein n=1 Tax=Colletotrichum asianum TaxID=702518 RepID=A0A8H3WQH7_9PEZI|nr:hypothetical protein GQ607_002456 [Colletotrichum asianum]
MMEWTFRCCETWDFLIASAHPCSFASIPDGNHSEPLARHPKRFHALVHTDGNRPWHAELGLERRRLYKLSFLDVSGQGLWSHLQHHEHHDSRCNTTCREKELPDVNWTWSSIHDRLM